MNETFAQVPDSVNYQAVVRDAQGNPLINTSCTIELHVYSGTVTGTHIYGESHTVITNAHGLFNVYLGGGIPLTGSFAMIDWSNGPFFLNIKCDAGQGLADMGTSQLVTVPFAFRAAVADSLAGGIPTVTGPFVPNSNQPVPLVFQGTVMYVHPSDNAIGQPFGGYGILVGVNGQSETDGETNTSTAVATLGTGTYAAKTCSDLVAYGFNDWYLPSVQELDAIFKQSYLVAGLDLQKSYWTSTEYNAQNAWMVDFNTGIKSVDPKNLNANVRCVRK